MFRSINKTAFISIAAAFLTAGMIGAAFAQQVSTSEELDQALNAMPEMADGSKGDQTRSGSFMECFVDTPAFDQYSSPLCFSNGTAFTTTAVFRIANPPSNFTIFWSDSRCSSSSDTCFLPIRQYQNINLSASVLNNNNNTFVNTSATAYYEGFQ